MFFIHKFEHQCIVLLERGAAENVHLGEELEARDNEQKRILAELGAKIESSANFEEEQASGKRKKEDPSLSAVSRKYIGFLLTMIASFVVTSVHVEGIFYVLSSMALLESVIFALIGVVGKAILVITDRHDHLFSQSLFKFKNEGVGIFILQSGVSESPFYSFGNYGSTFSLI